MQLTLRLQKLFFKDGRAPRGLIQEIARETRVERHCVAMLLRGQARYVSLDALARICEYLAKKYRIDPRTLAAELIEFAPGEFWGKLVSCSTLQFCLGKRHDPDWGGKDYVMASDSYLQGSLFSQISDPSQRRAAGKEESETKKGKGVRAQHFPPAYLLLSPLAGKELPQSEVDMQLQQNIEEARRVQAKWLQNADSALIALGSVKVNSLVELLCAQWFHARPGVSEDDVSCPAERSVPLYFRFRSYDVQPRSCCGGMHLSRGHESSPGIYFEGEDGKWQHCPCDDDLHDAAFLMYSYRPAVGQIEMCCGGFSGEATVALAARLNDVISSLKPQYKTPSLWMGVYAVGCRFEHSRHDRERKGSIGDCELTLLPVGEGALERRLSPSAARATRAGRKAAKAVGPPPLRKARAARPK